VDPDRIEDVIVLDVPEAAAGTRLDVFLAERVRECSRSYIKRLIEEGYVTLDNDPTKPAHAVKAGETVIVTLLSEEEESFEPFGEEMDLDVVYQDVDIIVVNKPAGMPVHASRGHSSGTLVNALIGRGVELSMANDDPVRPGIVHRLDMDTTGCIVCAKNDGAHKKLQRQWRAREVTKEYLAIVHGTPVVEEGIIDRPLGRDERRRKQMAVRHNGKASTTQYRVQQSYGGFSLIWMLLKTGRTHQIRVHMSNMGHPVLCDPVYGREVSITEAGLRGSGDDATPVIDRQALHAERLAFAHPASGRWMDFRAPVHGDMTRALEILGGASTAERPDDT